MSDLNQQRNCDNCGLALKFDAVAALPQFKNEKDLTELYLTACPRCGAKLKENGVLLTKDSNGRKRGIYETLLD